MIYTRHTFAKYHRRREVARSTNETRARVKRNNSRDVGPLLHTLSKVYCTRRYLCEMTPLINFLFHYLLFLFTRCKYAISITYIAEFTILLTIVCVRFFFVK